MASVMLTVCALFLFLPLAKQDSMDNHLQSVLQAVEKIIDFYQRDYKNLNVDGLFGLRVLEGHLGALIKSHESGKLVHLDTSVITKLKKMKEKATTTCDLSLVHVKGDSERYFNQMSFVVKSPWNIFENNRKLVNITYAWSKITYRTGRSVTIDEESSDRCMSELIGSHKSHGESCDISSKCAFIMTAPGLLGYGITHQLLWTMLADKAGCTEKLQARLFELGRGDISALRLELCTNNYIQLRETVKKFPGGIVPGVQDLFLEQMFMCPSLGYVEFLDIDFLPQILSWQYQNGCYGKMRKTKVKFNLDPELTGQLEDDYYYDEEENAEAVDGMKKKINAKSESLEFKKFIDNRKLEKPNDAVWEMPNNKGRTLLVEKTMSGGCLAHKTAVASGALAMYLRYLCEPDVKEIFSVKHKLRVAEVPPLDSGKIENKHHGNKVNPVGEQLVGVGALNAAKERGIRAKLGKNIDDGGGLEKLKVNLNRESELVNPLDKLNKVQNAFEKYKNKTNVEGDKFQKSLNQEPDIKNNVDAIKPAENKNEFNLNNKLDMKKDDRNYDYKYDDDNNEDDDDENDEDEYDDENDELNNNYPDYSKRDDGKIDRNMNQYYDENDQDNDLKKVAGNDHDKNTDDNDDDYNADDGYNDGYDDNDRENVHPHINARNIGHGKTPDYDKEGFDDDENRLKEVKDYDDDEDGDDYEYDDKYDVMEQKKDEKKKEFILAKPNKKNIESKQPVLSTETISDQSMLSTTAFVIFAISLIIIFILYRFIRKRRIRFKVGHKYFHV